MPAHGSCKLADFRGFSTTIAIRDNINVLSDCNKYISQSCSLYPHCNNNNERHEQQKQQQKEQKQKTTAIKTTTTIKNTTTTTSKTATVTSKTTITNTKLLQQLQDQQQQQPGLDSVAGADEEKDKVEPERDDHS